MDRGIEGWCPKKTKWMKQTFLFSISVTYFHLSLSLSLSLCLSFTSQVDINAAAGANLVLTTASPGNNTAHTHVMHTKGKAEEVTKKFAEYRKKKNADQTATVVGSVSRKMSLPMLGGRTPSSMPLDLSTPASPTKGSKSASASASPLSPGAAAAARSSSPTPTPHSSRPSSISSASPPSSPTEYQWPASFEATLVAHEPAPSPDSDILHAAMQKVESARKDKKKVSKSM